jgi:hypothetical protein
VNGVLNMFGKFAGIAPAKTKRFSIKREFDKKGLKETLELIFSGMALQLGDKMNEKLKIKAAQAFKQIGIEPSDIEWEQIENEIRETGKSSTLEKLMEVNINGKNQTTNSGTTDSGEGDAGDTGDTNGGD